MPNEFLGLPIEGEIQHYARTQVEQYPIEQLYPIIKTLLDDPEVGSFGWTQSTPYFNDGDACVFGAYGVWVRSVNEEPQDTDEEDEDSYWDGPNYKYEVSAYREPPSPEHHIALMNAIESDHFDVVLEHTFGDPSEVTFRDGKVIVEYYEHD